jgi:hypothetical protein
VAGARAGGAKQAMHEMRQEEEKAVTEDALEEEKVSAEGA